MRITTESDKKYTASEINDIVIDVLECIRTQLLLNELEFSPADLYWIVTDVLKYVNNMMKGEFKLKRIKKNNWEVIYTDEKTAERKAKVETKRRMEKAAEYIHKTTGEFPKWKKDES